MRTELPKKEVNRIADLELKAKHICDTFNLFTGRVRVMFLIHRSKEGADSANNDKLEKLISTNEKEFEQNLYTLLEKKEKSDLPLRIYSSVNSRDMRKAVREFKINQLNADYYDTDSHNGFYLDIRNRFISALMKPSSAQTSLFIVDIDSVEEMDGVLAAISAADLTGNVLQKYPTKNGWHIVMMPFNPALLKEYEPKIQKDSLILLAY